MTNASVIALVLVIAPLRVSVPPRACVTVWVELAADPKFNAELIALVPLVFAAFIAPVAPAPVESNVKIALLLLLSVYPLLAVVEKSIPETLKFALTLGWTEAAPVNVAISDVPGKTLPLQFVLVLKSVLTLPQVMVAAFAKFAPIKTATNPSKYRLVAARENNPSKADKNGADTLARE